MECVFVWVYTQSVLLLNYDIIVLHPVQENKLKHIQREKYSTSDTAAQQSQN